MTLLSKLRRTAYVVAISTVNFLLEIVPFSKVRLLILKVVGVKCGDHVTIESGIRLDFPWRLTIGKNCYIGKYVYFDCRGGSITIGEDSDISEGALIYTLSHDIRSEDFRAKSGDVIIGRRSWICVRAIVLPGARLGMGGVLSANSVFAGVSDDFLLLVGNPALPVKQLNSNRASRVR